jgi:hypothetical protein
MARFLGRSLAVISVSGSIVSRMDHQIVLLGESAFFSDRSSFSDSTLFSLDLEILQILGS